jgi:hypothetical protein
MSYRVTNVGVSLDAKSISQIQDTEQASRPDGSQRAKLSWPLALNATPAKSVLSNMLTTHMEARQKQLTLFGPMLSPSRLIETAMGADLESRPNLANQQLRPTHVVS